MGTLVVLVECPVEGPHLIKEEEFYKIKIWMHIKNCPTNFITPTNLTTIVSPAGSYITHKKPYGEHTKRKILNA